jgi:hypothetical protein
MAEKSSEAPEDIGAPQSYLVLADGTPAYDRSGQPAGTVAHVLSDDREDIFHGLVLKTPDGHRWAGSEDVDGIYEHGVILAKPVTELAEPAETADTGSPLRRAWDWLIQPR